jgi:tRNA A37 threonylcarbamoyladenosine synthetase subunit TsaC/SUA5/YrdC
LLRKEALHHSDVTIELSNGLHCQQSVVVDVDQAPQILREEKTRREWIEERRMVSQEK